MRSLRYITALLLALGAVASAGTFSTSAEDKTKMLSDVTIYLEPPILEDGGMVIIVPRPVAVEDWRSQDGQDNPAARDSYLESNKPLPANSKRLGAIVNNPVSIVQFDYPVNGTYNFRFAPVLGSNYPWERLKTKLLSFGSAGDLHPITGADVDIPTVQMIYVLGSEMTEDQARALASETRLGFLKERYDCREYEMAIVCNASRNKLK